MVSLMTLRWMLGSTLAAGVMLAALPAARAGDPAPRVFKPDTLTVRVAAAKPGRPVTVPVVFHPPSGWHIDPAFPMVCKLFPPAGVAADKVLFQNADATLDAREGRIEVVLTSHETGKKLISAGLTFGIHDGIRSDTKIVKVLIEMDGE